MADRLKALAVVIPLAALVVSGGCYPNPQPPGLSPVPTLPAGMTPTPAPRVQTPLGQTPTLFVPQSMGELVPFVPQIETAAPASTGAPTASGPAPLQPAADGISPAVGSALYMQSCLCHGSQGQGVDAPPLRNSQYVQTAGDQGVYTTVAFGRSNTRMPPWLLGQCGPLSDAQVKSVVAYLHALQGVSPAPTATLAPAPTEAPTTAGPSQPARPSNPGGAGPALELRGDAGRGRALSGSSCAGCHGPDGLQGIANSGSDDGTVPVLNPIDPSIADPDPKVFAANVDLFVQHGSTPSGPSPQILMPAFGDSNLLGQQQIADLIAWVIFLNVNCPGLSCG